MSCLSRKGLRDIKTLGRLSREGRPTDRHMNRRASLPASDWNVDQHVYRKATTTPRSVRIVADQVKRYQCEIIGCLLDELHQAVADGLTVAVQELKDLARRLEAWSKQP